MVETPLSFSMMSLHTWNCSACPSANEVVGTAYKRHSQGLSDARQVFGCHFTADWEQGGPVTEVSRQMTAFLARKAESGFGVAVDCLACCRRRVLDRNVCLTCVVSTRRAAGLLAEPLS